MAFALAVFAAGGLGSLGGMLPFVVLMAAMYFMLVLPNQRKQKQWQATLGQLKTGDRVTTNGGIRGTVVSVKDDAVTVRTLPDGVKLEVVKSSVSAVTTEEEAAKA